MTTSEEFGDVLDLSAFEKTPKEISWKIFSYVPEEIDSIRLASSYYPFSMENLFQTCQLLRCRADEYLSERWTIPFVVGLRMIGAKAETRRLRKVLGKTPAPSANHLYVVKSLELDDNFNQIDIEIKIPSDLMSFFEHRLRLRQFPRDLFEMKRVWADVTEYILPMDLNDEWILETLRDAMGGDIGHVFLRNCSDTEEMAAVATIIEGMWIDSLEFQLETLTERIGSALLRTVREHYIDNVRLTVESFYKCDRVGFLLEMSSLVGTLELVQHYVHHIGPKAKRFFDSSDVYWADVIVDMLSRKLDTLQIDNQHYLEYLLNHAVEELMERLPALDKKLWFYATCASYENKYSYMENEHLVKIEDISHQDWLSVRHSSRIEEEDSTPESPI